MVADIFIPVELMEFEDFDDAYKFYLDYAKLAEFSIKRYRKSKYSS